MYWIVVMLLFVAAAAAAAVVGMGTMQGRVFEA